MLRRTTKSDSGKQKRETSKRASLVVFVVFVAVASSFTQARANEGWRVRNVEGAKLANGISNTELNEI